MNAAPFTYNYPRRGTLYSSRPQRGGYMNFHRGATVQSGGGGLLNFLKGIGGVAKTVGRHLFGTAKKLAITGAKAVASDPTLHAALKDSASTVVNDILAGENVAASLKKGGVRSGKDISGRVKEEALSRASSYLDVLTEGQKKPEPASKAKKPTKRKNVAVKSSKGSTVVAKKPKVDYLSD